jgi:hypothetical protein
MPKQKSTPEYVTREILKKEISASEQRLDTKIDNVEKHLDVKISSLDVKVDIIEKRLDAKVDSRFNQLDTKIETTSQSLKEYVDSRFTRLDAKTDNIERTVKDQGKKMDVYFQGIAKMIEGVTGKVTMAGGQLDDHEVRIAALEGKGPQPSRI